MNEYKEIAIDNLIPYANNARTHDEDQVDKIAKSIKEFGFINPVLIDKDNIIIAGHGRVMGAKKLGLEKVPCLRIEYLTEAQKKAYILADNKLAEDAGWDMEMVKIELQALENLDFDISLTGFNFDLEFGELDDVKAEEDDYDEPLPEEPKSKLGQVYQLGRHRLMVGDSTKSEDVEKLMGGHKADLLLTDPPYNVALGMGGSVDEARKRHRRTDGLVIMNDKMENDEFRHFLTKVFINAKQVMKAGASYYIWHADNEGYNFRGAMLDAGFTLRQTLIWKKQSITRGRQDFQWIHEPCLYGWNDGASHSWYSDRKQSTVLCFDKPSKSDIHPTMKPIPLFDYQIKCSSKTDDNILDLFGGSGTTMMACEQNGRNAFLMELDPRYADAIIDRWEKFTGEKAVLIYG